MRDGADNCITDLQHGELRPDGRPHRRQHRRRAQPDADRQGVPDAPVGGAEDHPRPGHRGRLQHPVRPRAASRRRRPGPGRTASKRSSTTASSCRPTTSSRSTRASPAPPPWPARPPATRSPASPPRSPSARRLDQIPNAVTQRTTAAFEPALDYCVVKIPRWPFDKFPFGDRQLGTQMKATGEVMAIDRSFEAALQKAVRTSRSAAARLLWEDPNWSDDPISRPMRRHGRAPVGRDGRPAPRRSTDGGGRAAPASTPGSSSACRTSSRMERRLLGRAAEPRPALRRQAPRLLRRPDRHPGRPPARAGARPAQGLGPAPRLQDGRHLRRRVRGGHALLLQHLRGGERSAAARRRTQVLVLGSGPIRIGQGIEFDYCRVHAVWALQEAGYKALIANSNPETVSTDFDTSTASTSSRWTRSRVREILHNEEAEDGVAPGTIVQFGGQTAINLAEPLYRTARDDPRLQLRDHRPGRGPPPLRGLPAPASASRSRPAPASAPSRRRWRTAQRHRLSGAGAAQLRARRPRDGDRPERQRARSATWRRPSSRPRASPVLIDKYLEGKEVEVDAICDGEDVLIPGIMEHIERAGVHSGDSMAVYPGINLTHGRGRHHRRLHARASASALDARGLMNVQYVIMHDDGESRVYVLEVNPRASRTVPFLSKVTGVPMVRIAVNCCPGQDAEGAGLRRRSLAAPAAGRRQGAGLLDVEADRRRHLPGPGDEVDRRGHGHRPRPSRRRWPRP